jgi:hypothetical protein
VNVQRLASRLPIPQAELEPRYAAYRAKHGPDLVGFLADLQVQGLLTTAQLRDALTAAEVELSEPAALLEHSKGPRHRPLGLIGKGAMGEVHMAQDRQLQRTVAVKRMLPAAVGRSGYARFFNEVQITAQLDHPGIVPVYALEPPKSEGELPSYTMKLIRGRTLDELISETKKLYDKGGRPDADHDLPARLELFLQVCAAMDYAHSRGVIHRDLKPENIMVGPFHDVIVMDWGCARIVGGAEVVNEEGLVEERANITRYGVAVGTPAYMSPEQALGHNDDLDAKSDQCMLGLILQEVVTLKWAIVGKSGIEVLSKAAEGYREPIVHYAKREKIPDDLVAIIRKATATSPADRYKTVGALADDVRRFLRDEPVKAHPDGMLRRMTRWVARNRELTLALGLGTALIGIVAVVATVAAGLIVLEAHRRSAERREEALATVLGAVSAQSHRIDTTIQKDEALLTGLAFSAQRALDEEPPPDRTYYRTATFGTPAGPPDVVDSPIYGRAISVTTADMTVAPDVDPKVADRRMKQLSTLEEDLARVLLLSDGPGTLSMPLPARQKTVANEGVPLVWAYVTSADGIIASIPGGEGEYPIGYDPRAQDWYALGFGQHAPRWSAASLDEDGMGLLVTASIGLFDHDGHPDGVASVDLSIPHIVDELLDPKGLSVPVEAYLLDKDGGVVVQSSLKGSQAEAPPPFPWPELLPQIGAAESGHAEVYDGGTRKIVAWSQMEALDWTYVIAGDEAELLGG